MRRVAILAVDACQSLDVVGPMEVFHGATEALRRRGARAPGYAPMLVGFGRGPVRTESGMLLRPEQTLRAVSARGAPRIDTFLVGGGPGVGSVLQRPRALREVRACAARARRVGSVCTGSFLLAGAGLLDGRRATTHWAYTDTLAELFPKVQVERDVIYVRDGACWTAAGVVAGIDLALAMVAEDHGELLATEVARWLVVFIRRAGGQAQTSSQLAAARADRPSLRDLLVWIDEHLLDDLSVAKLARRAATSVRTFARRFREETGTTPARYVENVRIQAAQRLLETSGRSIEEVARDVGLASGEALRRAFARTLGIRPSAYRSRSRGALR
jgi:transcriptional regulator GlxA family with amidase domain